MSQNEVARLLANTTSIKARAMLLLAYGCGLRPGEVIRLRVGDIDSGRGIIRIVQSKGDKDRQVIIAAIAQLFVKPDKCQTFALGTTRIIGQHVIEFRPPGTDLRARLRRTIVRELR